MTNHNNIIEIINSWASITPGKIAYTFLSFADEKEKVMNVTYEKLNRDIACVAANLKARTPARSAILCFAYNEMYEFIQTFFGCLAAGILAIPLYPPKNKTSHVLTAIIDAHPSFCVVTTKKTSSLLHSLVGHQVLEIDDFDSAQILRPSIKNNGLAFLQYTSGSIGTPKGVMVSHSNILANQEMIRTFFKQSADTDVLGWLPLHHDMGLIGNVIQPIFNGARAILMSPTTFFQNPMRWLQAISKFKAHTSGGPNFCYQLCVDSYDERKISDIDLSAWKIAFNGAEPIQSKTMEEFYKLYQKHFFDKHSFYPCYGLAEATLFVVGANKQEGPVTTDFDLESWKSKKVTLANDRTIKKLVSSGYVSDQVVIANPDTLELCCDLQIGEICLKGDHVTQGYWGLEQLTEKTFNCQLSNGDRYFRTGDLGFIYQQNLYVTGRLKDLIIVRGRNYYPQDIESAAKQSHSDFINTNSAAVEVEIEGEAKLVIIQEMPRRHRPESFEELIQLITDDVVSEIGIKPYCVVLVRFRSLPLTTSGKIKRQQIKQDYENNNLKVVCNSEDNTSDEILVDASEDSSTIAIKFREALAQFDQKLQHVPLNKALYQLGYDSLDIVKLINHLNSKLSLTLELDSVGQDVTLEILLNSLMNSSGCKLTPHTQEEPLQPFDLTANQLSLYFQQKLYSDSTHYIISETFSLTHFSSIDALRNIVDVLVSRHPILNAKLLFQGNRLQIVPLSSLDDCLAVHYDIKEDQISAVIDSHKRTLTKMNHALTKINIFVIPESSKIYVNVNIHHLIFDLWSASILIEEIISLLKNKPLPLQNDFRSYAEYNKKLLTTNANIFVEAWEKIVGSIETGEKDNNSALLSSKAGPRSARVGYFNFNKTTVNKLRTLASSLQCTLYELLLAAFSFTVYKYTALKKFIIMSPFNGRTHSHYHHTIGYFLNVLPILVALDTQMSVTQFILKVSKIIHDSKQVQYLPIAKIAEIINEKIDADTLLPYELMFTYQKLPNNNQAMYNQALTNAEQVIKFDASTLQRLPHDAFSIEVDWDMAVFEDEQLHGYLKYNEELFDAPFIEQFIQHFLTVTDIFVHSPKQLLHKINILTEQELDYLVHEFNRDNITTEGYQTLMDVFEETVKHRPEQIAITEGEAEITYKDFSDRVSSLAAELLADD